MGCTTASPAVVQWLHQSDASIGMWEPDMTTLTWYSPGLIGLLILLMFAGNARAESPDIGAVNNRVLIQVVSTRVDYSETGNGYLGTATGVLDTETGAVMGVGLSLSRMRPAHNVYWQAGFDYSSGRTKYTGSLLGGGGFGSYTGTSSATLANYEGRLGKGFEIREDFLVTPYMEAGGHRWDRGVSYGELYTHYYYGFGVMAQYSPRPKLVLSVEGLLGRTVQSHIVVNGGALMNGFSASLGNSPLSRIGAAVDYAFNPQVHGNVTVEYMKFRYGASSAFPIGGGLVAWEPDSDTRYLVVKAGLAVPF